MPIEPDLDEGMRLIKIEIATNFCECVQDVLGKIQKKLTPFAPMVFREVFFNNKRIPSPETASLTSLLTDFISGGCLYCSVGILSMDASGIRNARVHIEDRIFRTKQKEAAKVLNSTHNNSVKRLIDPNSMKRQVFMPTNPMIKMEARSNPTPPMHQVPSLMAGGIVNMVPDVLEDCSSPVSSGDFIQPPPLTNSNTLIRGNVRKMPTTVAARLVRARSQSNDADSRQRNISVVSIRQSEHSVSRVPSLTSVIPSNANLMKSYALLSPSSACVTQAPVKNAALIRSQNRDPDGNFVLPQNPQNTKKPILLPSSTLALFAKKSGKIQHAGVTVNDPEMNPRPVKPSPDPHSWVEDGHFQRMIEMNGIPSDPEQWNETHVQIWIRWASKHFGFNKQRSEVLQKIHGRNLMCDLPAPQIVKMVECPPEVADTFLIHLKLLREKRIVAVPRDASHNARNNTSSNTAQCYRVVRGNNAGPGASPSRLVTSGIANSGVNGTGRLRGYGRGHFAPVASSSSMMLSTIQQPFVSGGNHNATLASSANAGAARRNFNATESGISNGLTSSGTGNNSGPPQLWQFLLDMLTDWRYYNDIQWNTDDGEFKLINPERVARAWGERKNKPTMNYEKLSRALRYYYDGDMLAKVQGKKFVYKFVCNLKHLLGYEAKDLRRLVEKCAVQHREELEQSRANFMYAVPSNLSNSSSAVAHMNNSRTAGPVRAPSANRFHPYAPQRFSGNLSPGMGQIPRPFTQRSHLQTPRPLQIMSGRQTVVMPSEVSEPHTNIADNLPFLSNPSERWKTRNASGSLWPAPTDISEGGTEGSIHDDDVDDSEEAHKLSMPNLTVNPVCSSISVTANSSSTTTNISPIKFLNAGISSDSAMNASVEAELTQYLSGDFHPNGELSIREFVEGPDDIELDNFLTTFEERTISTSPNRQMQSNGNRQHVGLRNTVHGSTVVGNCSGSIGMSNITLGMNAGTVNSNGVAVISPNDVVSEMNSFDNEGIKLQHTRLEIPNQPRGLISIAAHGNGTPIVTAENTLTNGSSNDNQYSNVNQTVDVPDNDGETSLLNPFLETPGPHVELSMDSDNFDEWTC